MRDLIDAASEVIRQVLRVVILGENPSDDNDKGRN
jgi:hypothetical protein